MIIFKSSIIKSIIKLFTSNIIVNIIRFVYITILIKFYSFEQYGLFVLILGYLSMIRLFAGFGLENIIISKMVVNRKNNSLFNIYMLFFSLLLISGSMVLLYFNNTILLNTIIVFILFSIINTYNTTILYAQAKHTLLSKIIVIQGLFTYISLILIILFYKVQIVDLIYYEFIFKIFLLLMFIFIYSKDLVFNVLFSGKINLKYIILFFRFIKSEGKWLIYNLIVNKLLNQSLTIIFGEFISLSFLGIWDAIAKVLAVFQIAVSYLEQVIISTKKKSNILKTKDAQINKILVVSFLSSLIAIVLTNSYIYYLEGKIISNNVYLTVLLSLTLTTYGYKTFMRALFTIKGWTKEIFKLNIVSNIIQVGGVYLLVIMNIAKEINVALLYLFVSILGYFLYEYYYRKKVVL